MFDGLTKEDIFEVVRDAANLALMLLICVLLLDITNYI